MWYNCLQNGHKSDTRHSIRHQNNLDLKFVSVGLIAVVNGTASERAVEMCRDFVFVRFHLLAFHFNEFQTCQTQPNSISCQTVKGSLGFAQTIKTSKVDRWFGFVPDQIGTLSQVGTSSYMAYAM